MHTSRIYTLVLAFFFVAISTIHVASEVQSVIRLNAGKRELKIPDIIYQDTPEGESDTTWDVSILRCKKILDTTSKRFLFHPAYLCFEKMAEGIIGVHELENYIVRRGTIGKQHGSPWEKIRHTVKYVQPPKLYNKNIERKFPEYTPSQQPTFTITSNLNLEDHDQLAQKYLEITKKVFEKEPFIDVGDIENAMDETEPLPRSAAYELGSYLFVDDEGWQALSTYIPERALQEQRKTTERIVRTRDLFELACQARYRGESLKNIKIKNHTTKGVTLMRRWVSVKQDSNWASIDLVLKKLELRFMQKRGLQEEKFIETSKKRKREETPKKFQTFTPHIRHFINNAAQQELGRYIPKEFLKRSNSTKKTIGLWDFFDLICQTWDHGDESLYEIDIKGVNINRASLQRRYTDLQSRPFWRHIKPILQKLVDKTVQISAGSSDEYLESAHEYSESSAEYSSENI
jgi:hypothetical protein